LVSLKVTTQPVCEPVSLDTVKNHLKVSYSDDDSLIAIYIQAAREWCESYVNRSFIKKTYQMTLAWLPLFDYRQQGSGQGTAPNPGWYNGLWVADSLKIKLLRPNLIPGSSTIAYADLSGNTQTLHESNNDYQVNPYSEPSLIMPKSGVFWPWTQYSNPTAVKITYDAGSGDETAIQAAIHGSPAVSEVTARQAAVPGWVKLAILQLVGHWYEHRESVSELNLKEVPLGIKNIIGMYCVDDFAPTNG